jgi:nicotinamidase/pyrazinamidase
MSPLLLVVDVQNDFCPGGALEVAEGDRVVPLINYLRNRFERVVLTQDWHPANHTSFAVNHKGKKVGDVVKVDGIKQILWPAHCVQGSPGAQFQKDLVIRPQDLIYKKGTDPRLDSYSAFYDNGHRKSTGLGEALRKLGIREVTVCGLATDVCVKYSVLDALQQEFRVNVVVEACRAVNLEPKDGEKAMKEMQREGAHLMSISDFGGSSS